MTITYASQNEAVGTVSQSQDYLHPVYGTASSSTAQAKTGHHFVKWVDAEGNTVGTEAAFTPVKAGEPTAYAAAAYTAVFAADTYTITYTLDGGSNHGDNPYIYEYGQKVLLETPVRDGYDFLGWYDKDGNRITEITVGEMGDLELFAQWAKASSVTDLPQTGNGSQFKGLLAVILGGALTLSGIRARRKSR